MDVWKSVMRKDIEMEVLVAWTRIRFLVLVRFIYNSGRSCISPVCLNWNFNLYWTSLNTLAADFAVGSLSLPENITGMGEVVRRRPIIAGRERGEFVTAHFRRFICGNDCVERIIQQSEEIWRFILAQGFVRSSDMHRMHSLAPESGLAVWWKKLSVRSFIATPACIILRIELLLSVSKLWKGVTFNCVTKFKRFRMKVYSQGSPGL